MTNNLSERISSLEIKIQHSLCTSDYDSLNEYIKELRKVLKNACKDLDHYLEKIK